MPTFIDYARKTGNERYLEQPPAGLPLIGYARTVLMRPESAPMMIHPAHNLLTSIFIRAQSDGLLERRNNLCLPVARIWLAHRGQHLALTPVRLAPVADQHVV